MRERTTPEAVALTATNCPLCSSASRVHVVSASDYEYCVTADVFNYDRCAQCGLIYLNPRPEVQDLPRFYPATYEQYHDGTRAMGLKRFLHAVRAKTMIEPRMNHLLRKCGMGQALKVLDIGCGNGAALLAVGSVAQGCELHGVDIDDTNKATLEKCGIVLHKGSFEGVDLPGDHFDIIMLSHVIEHFVAPVEVTKKIHRLLRPGGMVYMETHISDCLEQRIFGRYWIGFDAPRHLTVFDRKTLLTLLSISGFSDAAYDDHIISVTDLLDSSKRLCLDKTRSRACALFVSDRNPIMLAGSALFNVARLALWKSSVARVTARKMTPWTRGVVGEPT